jgi:hypothetical protein
MQASSIGDIPVEPGREMCTPSLIQSPSRPKAADKSQLIMCYPRGIAEKCLDEVMQSYRYSLQTHCQGDNDNGSSNSVVPTFCYDTDVSVDEKVPSVFFDDNKCVVIKAVNTQ